MEVLVLFFRKSKKMTPQDKERRARQIKLQLDMIQVLMNHGYTYDDIDFALGFSEICSRFMREDAHRYSMTASKKES